MQVVEAIVLGFDLGKLGVDVVDEVELYHLELVVAVVV